MDQNEGHREYAAERKANIIRLADDLRGSDALLAQFTGDPGQTATKYGLKLTEEEVTALVSIAGSGELNEDALAAVAGGSMADNGVCINNICPNEV